MDPQHQTEQPNPVPTVYEPPCIEHVMTAEDLAREVQYAGGISVDNIT